MQARSLLWAPPRGWTRCDRAGGPGTSLEVVKLGAATGSSSLIHAGQHRPQCSMASRPREIPCQEEGKTAGQERDQETKGPRSRDQESQRDLTPDQAGTTALPRLRGSGKPCSFRPMDALWTGALSERECVPRRSTRFPWGCVEGRRRYTRAAAGVRTSPLPVLGEGTTGPFYGIYLTPPSSHRRGLSAEPEL
jgi:hypothetical protein